jgi:hypothetical protein
LPRELAADLITMTGNVAQVVQDRRDLRLVFAATPAEALQAALDEHPAEGHSRVS